MNKLHAFLQKEGAEVEIGRLHCRHETGDAEPEPEDIVDASLAFETIRDWPRAGWTHYQIHGCSFLVEFVSQSNGTVSGILFDAFENEFQEQSEFFKFFFSSLHNDLKALRTVMGTNICQGTELEKEIARSRLGVFKEIYEMDLRSHTKQFPK